MNNVGFAWHQNAIDDAGTANACAGGNAATQEDLQKSMYLR
jgi:hypothetical protein